MDKMTIKQRLSAVISAESIFINEPLHPYTFTLTGGQADVLVVPSNYDEVQQVISFTYTNDIPLTIIGNGSNLIIRDGGIRGIVLIMKQMNDIRTENHQIIAQSGARIIDTSRHALSSSLSGLEFACGIPGTVGGAVYMNAGAYGGQISDCLDSILVVDKKGQLLELKADDLALGYRTSILASARYTILEARFSLKQGESNTIEEKMNELTMLRSSKQPLEYPSCGSVFKRPPGLFAGKLIQDSGLQGHRIGGVEVSKKHAGFMVNVDNGTASDYLHLIAYVQRTVFENIGVHLETEVKIIGEDKKIPSNLPS